MKANKRYIKIFLLYISMLIIIICTILIRQLNYDGKPVIIYDREKVIENVNNYIPIRIEFYNKKWGKGEIRDSKTIRDLWAFINSLPKNSNLSITDTKEYTESELKGTIYYLNGKKESLNIGDMVRINNYIYGDMNSKAEAVHLKNRLNEELYTNNNIATFINEKNKIVIINENNDSKKLGNEDKVKLKKSIEDSSKIIATKNLTEYMNKKGKICYHIKVYVDQEKNEGIINRADASNIINIDVYENKYFVVTDLENENGNLIHMSGQIKGVCDKVFN